jgi:hypothetical protein
MTVPLRKVRRERPPDGPHDGASWWGEAALSGGPPCSAPHGTLARFSPPPAAFSPLAAYRSPDLLSSRWRRVVWLYEQDLPLHGSTYTEFLRGRRGPPKGSALNPHRSWPKSSKYLRPFSRRRTLVHPRAHGKWRYPRGHRTIGANRLPPSSGPTQVGTTPRVAFRALLSEEHVELGVAI